jgi:hypothetical protein
MAAAGLLSCMAGRVGVSTPPTAPSTSYLDREEVARGFAASPSSGAGATRDCAPPMRFMRTIVSGRSSCSPCVLCCTQQPRAIIARAGTGDRLMHAGGAVLRRGSGRTGCVCVSGGRTRVIAPMPMQKPHCRAVVSGTVLIACPPNCHYRSDHIRCESGRSPVGCVREGLPAVYTLRTAAPLAMHVP